MDLNLLVEKVTAEVMKILSERVAKPKILIQEDTKDETFFTALSPHCTCVSENESEGDWDYILLSKSAYDALQKKPTVAEVSVPTQKNCLDFTNKKLVTEKEIRSICFATVTQVLVAKRTIVTPAAKDLLRTNGITITVRDCHV